MKRPNFLIVGAAKSGTTSLHYYLNQHPEVFMPLIKETYFLTGMTRRDFPSYFKNPVIDSAEDYDKLFAGARRFKAVGEACVAYLYHFEQTIPRIHEYLDNPQIFIILRNPVDRAFSQFLELNAQGFEELTFEKAIEVEEQRAAEGHWWWSSQYVNIGRYFSQVKAYIDAFGQDRVKIFLYEKFAENPQSVTAAIFKDIGVNETFIPNVAIRYKSTGLPKNRFLSKFLIRDNQIRKLYRNTLPLSWRTRISSELIVKMRDRSLKKPILSSDIRLYLQNEYAPDLLRLKEFTNIDFETWWWQVE